MLSGMGDHIWFLLDKEDWAYLEACDNHSHGDPIPVPSESLIERAFIGGEYETRDEARASITLNPSSGSATNDIALCMPPSEFNGETFYDLHGSPLALKAFTEKHNIKYVEAYDGYIY